MSDGKVVYEVRADYDKLDSDLNSANSKIEKGTSKWGSLLQGVGQGIGHFVADKAVEAAKAVWELGTAFEDGLAKVSTLVDTASVDMDQLGDSLLDLSSKYGLEASNLAESTYNAISSNNALGKDSEALMKVLESSAKLAKAGFTDVDTATSATLKTLNAYGLGVESVDRIQKVLIQTQNTGITTVGELGAVLAQVTPSAAAAGIQFEEVGAALATMTAQGTPAAQATTQLNAVITAFMKPTADMISGLSGIADEMIKNGQLSGENADHYTRQKERLAELSREILECNDGTKESNQRYKELQNEIKLVNKEIDAATAEMSLQILEANGLQGTLELLNKEFGGSTNQMAAALSSSEALKASLAITGKNAETFTSNLHAMSTEADVVGEGFEKVSSTTNEKLNVSFAKVKALAIELFQSLEPLISVVLSLAGAIIQAISTGLQPILTIIKTITTAIENWYKKFSPLLDALLGVQDACKGLVMSAMQPLLDMFTRVTNAFSNFYGTIVNKVKGAISSVSGLIGSLTDKVSSLWSTLTGGGSSKKSSGRSFAVGNDFVPEDNYPALLHRGEAVLTAAEAKVWRAGGNTRAGQLSSATIGGASIDYDKLARSMSGMTVVMDKQKVGYILTPEISYNQAMNSDSLERSGFNG